MGELLKKLLELLGRVPHWIDGLVVLVLGIVYLFRRWLGPAEAQRWQVISFLKSLQ